MSVIIVVSDPGVSTMESAAANWHARKSCKKLLLISQVTYHCTYSASTNESLQSCVIFILDLSGNKCKRIDCLD